MSHLTRQNLSWHARSPVTIDITVAAANSASLSALRWRLADVTGATLVEVLEAAMSTADDDDGDAVVSVPLTADDLDLAAGRYEWQLHGSVSGEGPKVLAEGALILDALHPAPAA